MNRRLAPILACALLCGCVSTVPSAKGPTDVAVPAEFAAAYRPPAGDADFWWRGFGDPELDSLVERALARNLDIATARARLAAARAIVSAERADRLPSAGIAASAESEIEGRGDADPVASGRLAVLFDPDLSGRLSAETQAAAASAAAADYLVSDQRRLVAAATAQQYIELRRTGARLALLEESTALQERTLRIVTLRHDAGLSANLDVRRAAADLARTRAERGLLELARAEAANALAVLTGDTPGAPRPLDETKTGIPQFAGGPPLGTPADLLRRRPDLLVAEARLLEAAAQIGVQRADLLPSLVISGEIVANDGGIDDIFSELFLTIGAALDLPLFDGGRRRAEIDAAEAEADARFSEYRHLLLRILAEVENALIAIEAYSDRNADLARAIEESEAAFGQSNALYREGLASLFDVLDAQRQLISSRESLIDSEASLAASIVALYASVGSGRGAGRLSIEERRPAANGSPIPASPG
jgi:multidrug efflux system outer membrane protein